MRSVIAKIRADFAPLGNLENSAGEAPARGFARLTQVLAHVATEHDEPAKLGCAVALGVTVGLTPLFGFHLLICLVLASALKLNKILVYAAANISLPVMIPLIAVACVEVGYFAVHGHLVALDANAVDKIRYEFLGFWFLGALINGVLFGGLAGMVVWRVAKARREKGRGDAAYPALAGELIERLYEAFRPEGRFKAEILKGKIRHDVVYAAVVAKAKPGLSVLDVGGGAGALPLLIGIAAPNLKSSVVLDWDAAKLARGRAAAERLCLPVKFREADVFQAAWAPGSFDWITCIDVLHYADLSSQRHLVTRLAGCLKQGGRLLIRDMDADQRARTLLTVCQERFSLGLGLTRAKKVEPRSGTELENQLQALGLKVERLPCRGRTPFSNTLWIATKPDVMLGSTSANSTK